MTMGLTFPPPGTEHAPSLSQKARYGLPRSTFVILRFRGSPRRLPEPREAIANDDRNARPGSMFDVGRPMFDVPRISYPASCSETPMHAVTHNPLLANRMSPTWHGASSPCPCEAGSRNDHGWTKRSSWPGREQTSLGSGLEARATGGTGPHPATRIAHPVSRIPHRPTDHRSLALTPDH